MGLPKIEFYPARDGSELPIRLYDAESERVMVLVHGISEDCKYLSPFAKFISSSHLAKVYTPDLRGYGESPIRRGDVDYIGQHEDDLADLIQWIKAKHQGAKIILAGHSAGGGTTIRFGASRHNEMVDAYLLLAPFLGSTAPTERPSDGYFEVNMARVVSLVLLNALGIRKWDHLPAMKINRPVEERHGSETLELSYRLLLSRSPKNYKKDLPKLTQPTLVVAGLDDEAFFADQYEPVFKAHSTADVKIIPSEDHDGILSNQEAHELVRQWMEGVARV